MATYITLLKFTEQGLKTIKEGPSRLERAKQLARSMGGRRSFADAPSDEVVARFSLAIGSLGNVHTETLRAFTEDEYRKMVSALP